MSKHKCPHCGTATRRVAASFGTVPLDFVAVHPLSSKQNFWTGGFPVVGVIVPEICPECDLVSWFHYREAEKPSASGDDPAGNLPIVSGEGLDEMSAGSPPHRLDEPERVEPNHVQGASQG